MWSHLQHLESELIPLCDVDVGLLIGYNCPRALTPREVVPPVNDNDPYGQKTDLGWGIVGTVYHKDVDHCGVVGFSHRVMTSVVPCALQSEPEKTKRVCVSYKTSIKEVPVYPADVSKMMEMDFNDRKCSGDPLSLDDQEFLSMMENGIHQGPDGHYEMPLPFKGSDPILPNNRTVALNRLQQLKRRFVRDQHFQSDYKSFMDKLLKNHHAEQVPVYDVRNESRSSWYIPHHGVYHPKKRDKIRVVFDCSAQHHSISLNDHLLKGPEMTNTLIGVLCRFRKEPIAVQCDIEQMFYQFNVVEKHRDYLRFLWFDNNDINSEPIDYRMTVHLFGAASSPGCANYGLKQVSKDYEDQYGSDAAKFVRENFYVDDGLTSVSTVEEAVQLIQKSKQMCSEGGIRLHKFISNSRDVLAAIPEEDCAKEVKGIDLMKDPLPLERALGVNWCIESDTFQFRITLKDQPLIRRSVLSTINSIYDPLGFIAPVVLTGKQVLQAACKDQLDWDSPLPDNLRSQWEKWRSELFYLEELAIPRCFKPEHFGEVKSQELHHFADASMLGYGQCTYLRSTDINGNVCCAFVIGKARVCPLKPVTIPRLELTAAVISVRISQFLQRELHCEKLREVFWSDSQAVLGYISNDSVRYHVFVGNRVQQIREHTTPDQWRHVKGVDNPADEASRGVSAQNLATSTWLSGPRFLCDPNFDIDNQECERFEVSLDDSEIKRVKTLASSVRTTFELENAELEILKHVQSECFSGELKVLKSNIRDCIDGKCFDNSRQSEVNRKWTLKQVKGTSPLFKLDPFVDSNGLLRVGGRVQLSELSDNLKHPIILPKRHHITTLIIGHYHEEAAHQGRGLTANAIRAHGFWIIGCSSSVRYHIAKCVICRKQRGSVQEQKMSNLPTERMSEAPPFTYCGMDMFGPFYVKEGRKELKRYGALFTCLVCRAVHIEVTHTLSTDSFINALRRFISVRGPVRQLRCDQGTNFVGAQGELYDPDSVKNFMLSKNCDFVSFVMNPPSASHMGGAWERQIRSIRSVLSNLMSQVGKQLDDEGLRTLMAEVMAIVNSRPFTVDTLFDPNSSEPLTPNHLLTTKSNIVLPPPGKFQKEDMYSRKQWRRVQHCVNEFWHRWRREFVQNLQVRQKWLRPCRTLKAGDVVLIMDDNLPRNQWKIARVCETYTGKDNLVLRVKVAVGNRNLTVNGKRLGPVSYLERPIHKLVLLVEKDEQNEL
ncbi:uncharacterized protein LOC124260222 [Haliotis rubra]|uniref:uncharacterized protein LOC124260222 n=1 Tax=Haliotis rubra TaxID=36100 RepID=UPI001EE5E83A|nr:uncharacterized protein LOC124260222 [Haliotis rubra]